LSQPCISIRFSMSSADPGFSQGMKMPWKTYGKVYLSRFVYPVVANAARS